MIVVGGGAQGVSREVTELANYLQAPVMSYRTGMGVVDARNHLSLHQPAAEPLWAQTDVVLAIGSNMRVPQQKWVKKYQHKPTIIRIDVDPTTHQLFHPVEVPITARAEDTLSPLIAELQGLRGARSSRQEKFAALKGAWAERSSVLEPQLSYLNVIREALGEDGIFVDELTQVGFVSRFCFPVYRPRTFISTGYQGTLGYGFPTALGVKVARPEVPVISIAGDGGFMFSVQELATAVQHGINSITIVFNNGQYGNVQQMQKALYDGRVIASDLKNPDFVRLGKAFGAFAQRAHSPQELAVALSQAKKAQAPAVIEVPVGDMPSVDQFR